VEDFGAARRGRREDELGRWHGTARIHYVPSGNSCAEVQERSRWEVELDAAARSR